MARRLASRSLEGTSGTQKDGPTASAGSCKGKATSRGSKQPQQSPWRCVAGIRRPHIASNGNNTDMDGAICRMLSLEMGKGGSCRDLLKGLGSDEWGSLTSESIRSGVESMSPQVMRGDIPSAPGVMEGVATALYPRRPPTCSARPARQA